MRFPKAKRNGSVTAFFKDGLVLRCKHVILCASGGYIDVIDRAVKPHVKFVKPSEILYFVATGESKKWEMNLINVEIPIRTFPSLKVIRSEPMIHRRNNEFI
jgi:hypothetical protein